MAAWSLRAASLHASHSHSRGPLLTACVFGDALHRLDIFDESAIEPIDTGFIGMRAALPTVPTAQRSAGAQARGASLEGRCIMRSIAQGGSDVAAAGGSVGGRLAGWRGGRARAVPLPGRDRWRTGRRPAPVDVSMCVL